MLPPTQTAVEALFALGEKTPLTRDGAASGDTESLGSRSSAPQWAYKTSTEAAVKHPRQ